MGPRTPHWLNSTTHLRVSVHASVYAGDLGQCEELQTVSTRGEEEDGIQTHAAVVFTNWPDPIGWICAAASEQHATKATRRSPALSTRLRQRRRQKAGGESSTSRLKLLLWCGTLRKQVSVRFRFVRTKQPRGRLTLAALATAGAEQRCNGAASANPIGFWTADWEGGPVLLLNLCEVYDELKTSKLWILWDFRSR